MKFLHNYIKKSQMSNNLIKIKKRFDSLLLEAVQSDNKTLAKELYEELSANKSLQTLYYCVNNLENPPSINENLIEDFINENIETAKTIDKKQLTEIASKLDKVELLPLHENIGVLLFEKRNAFNFVEYNQAKENIIAEFKNKMEMEQQLASLTEDEISVVKTFANDPKAAINNLTESCIKILNEQLENETDDETVIMILKAKNKLMENQMKCELKVENVIDLLTFQKNLLT